MQNILILNPSVLIRHRLIPSLTFNLKIFWIFSFVSILFLLVFSIFQVNAYIQEIYLIKNYEKKLQTLSQENEGLEIGFSKSYSLENIENYILSQNFERIGTPEYVRVLEGWVLTK